MPMIKFMMKCFLLTSVLLFGILFGMQQANNGMKQMKGYDDPSLDYVVQIKEQDNGNIEASVLGEKVSSKTIEEKKQKLEEIESFNFFSSVGEKISHGISYLFLKMIEICSAGIDLLLK